MGKCKYWLFFVLASPFKDVCSSLMTSSSGSNVPTRRHYFSITIHLEKLEGEGKKSDLASHLISEFSLMSWFKSAFFYFFVKKSFGDLVWDGGGFLTQVGFKWGPTYFWVILIKTPGIKPSLGWKWNKKNPENEYFSKKWNSKNISSYAWRVELLNEES